MKKVIIFSCVDNFGKEYEFAKSSEEEDVQRTIQDVEKQCTEVEDYKVLDLY